MGRWVKVEDHPSRKKGPQSYHLQLMTGKNSVATCSYPWTSSSSASSLVTESTPEKVACVSMERVSSECFGWSSC